MFPCSAPCRRSRIRYTNGVTDSAVVHVESTCMGSVSFGWILDKGKVRSGYHVGIDASSMIFGGLMKMMTGGLNLRCWTNPQGSVSTKSSGDASVIGSSLGLEIDGLQGALDAQNGHDRKV